MTKISDLLMAKGPDVIVSHPATTVTEVARLMTEGNVGSIIIRDEGIIKGIFTERDLLRRVVARGKNPKDTLVEEVMSSPVVSCHLDDDIRECATMLAREHIRHLVVTESGALIGVIGLRDIHQILLRNNSEWTEPLHQGAE